MTKGFAHVRVSHAGAALHHQKRQDASCETGGFYTNPTGGMTVNTGNTLNITWDATCLSATSADIYLYAYASSGTESAVHMWQNIPFAQGYMMAELDPTWWNSTVSTPTVPLQLAIIQHGDQPWMSSLPAAPIWTANNTGTPSGASDTNVNDFAASGHALSHGKVAAAVIMPLVIVLAVFTYLYMKFIRQKTQAESKRFSVHIDKQMSRLSADWKSMTPAGGSVAARESYRNSTYSLGANGNGGGRPSSTFASEGGRRSLYNNGSGSPEMSQIRPGVRSSAFESRKSRVSFAETTHTRPSTDSRKGVTSRAFHNGFVPPLPNRDSSLSPEQRNGPLPLTPDDIAHLTGTATADGTVTFDASSVGDFDVGPALSMMRSTPHDDSYLFPTTPTPIRDEFPLPPTPTYQSPVNPQSKTIAKKDFKEAVAPVMTPDDMMRAYAARKASLMSSSGSPSPAASEISFPMPSALPSGMSGMSGMRTLYGPNSPLTPDSSAPMLSRQQQQQHEERPRMYRAPSMDYGADAYGGTA